MVCLVSSFPIVFDPYFLALFVDPVGDSCLKSVLRARSPVGLFRGFGVIVLLHLGVLPHLWVSLVLKVFLVFSWVSPIC